MFHSSVSRRDAMKTGAAAALGLAFGPRPAAAQSNLPLITKTIPSSGEKIPVIGLGTNAYSVNTPEAMAPLREVIQRMGEMGGTVIDTARAYGRSEAVIGEILAGLGSRKQFFIATKTPIGGDFSNPQAVLDVSFGALKVDTIDLMQIHMFNGTDAMMPVFEKAKAAKRIRYIGISTSTDNQYPQLIAAMKQYPLDFVQVDYSIENRNAAESVLAAALERKVGVLINVPFGGRGRGAAGTFAKVKGRELPPFAREFDAATWAQFFLKYIVSHPAVTVAIPGTRQVAHVNDNFGAAMGRLPDAALRRRQEEFFDSIS
jgi:aryl-alcohol dehydrogenase-like predicted oxidoreductase